MISHHHRYLTEQIKVQVLALALLGVTVNHFFQIFPVREGALFFLVSKCFFMVQYRLFRSVQFFVCCAFDREMTGE